MAGAVTNDELIKFRLPAELKAEAKDFCVRNDVTVGAWLRSLMRESLGHQPTHPRPRRRKVKPLTLSDGTKLRR